jgi:hypothetical protein
VHPDEAARSYSQADPTRQEIDWIALVSNTKHSPNCSVQHDTHVDVVPRFNYLVYLRRCMHGEIDIRQLRR